VAPTLLFFDWVIVAKLIVLGCVTLAFTFGAVLATSYRRIQWKRGIRRRARLLATDPDAVAATPGLPAFVAKPRGAPVYYGFRVLDDVDVEGFKLGMISDWEAQAGMESGDAFVVAPDGSRCGISWYRSPDPTVTEAWRIDLDRWGVWNVGFPYPLDSHTNARRNLEAILPPLHDAWMSWRDVTAKWRD
jgi:hypothetical protein